MKWFFANSIVIVKRKHKNTYSLWLEGQDIPAEESINVSEVAADNQNKLELISNQVDTLKFPDWYVSISFGKSTSVNYSKAIMIAKQAPQYIEGKDEFDNIIDQAIFSSEPKEYLTFISLYELVKDWKSSFVVVDGQVMDRKIIGGLNYCYGDNIRSGNPDFCYGASQFTENPFGCHRLQVSSYNNPWWSFGYFDSVGMWRIDKVAIKNRIAEFSIPYASCPAFSFEQVLKNLNDLPDYIDVRKDDEWMIIGNSVVPREHHQETVINLDFNLNETVLKSEKKSGCFTTVLSVVSIISLAILNVL